jgi:hypothetical protein
MSSDYCFFFVCWYLMCSEVKICITQVFKYNHIPIKLHGSDSLSNYFPSRKKYKKRYLNMFIACAKKQTKSNYILAIQNIRPESKSSAHSALKKFSRKRLLKILQNWLRFLTSSNILRKPQKLENKSYNWFWHSLVMTKSS